jgi:hypothetical protein
MRFTIAMIIACAIAWACSGKGSSADGGATDSDSDSDTDTDTDSDSDTDSDTDIPPDPEEICERPVDLVDTSTPDRVVGDGTAGSCTEQALADAIASGGVIVFDCGPNPHTITLTAEQQITADTVLDGGDLITLSGGGQTRILNMDTGNFEATSPQLTVQRLTFRDGQASGTPTELGYDVDGGGGAIFYRGGSVTAIDCVFVDNQAADIGPDVGGGAIYGIGVGETIAVGCRFAGNRGSNAGAIGSLHTGLVIYNSTIVDNLATGYGANYIDEFGDQAGHGGNGGAIAMDGVGRTLDICGTTISGNTGGAYGGALFRTGYETEPSIFDRCVIDGNQVPEPDDPEHGSGAGGLYIQGTHVELIASTISNNAARAFAGAWILGHGPTPAIADLTNVTIAGNYTWPKDDFTTRGIGGGLIIGDNTTGTVWNCTIVDNEAQFASGIARVSPLTVNNTIISNLYDNEWCPLNCTGTSYNTPPGTGEHNLQWPTGTDDDMDCTPAIERADPLLGELADNGGPTETIAPLADSPAIEGGFGCPATDQRGVPRSEPCTIGAFEVE